MPQIMNSFNKTMSASPNNLEASVLVLAGEASGDYHAAALVKDLRHRFPKVEFTGIGGEKLQAAGMKVLLHYREINTIGLSGGFGKLKRVMAAYSLMKRELRSGKYDVFLAVDFPDVNIRLAAVAKKSGVKVCYYVSPQVWAWRKRRIYKIALVVDRMMTIFPFEEKLYSDLGVRANFVGHTMVRDIPPDVDRALLRSELGVANSDWLVTLAPGSRRSEITRSLPVMIGAAKLHLKNYPETKFIIPLAGPHLKEVIQGIIGEEGSHFRIIEVEAFRVMAASDSGLITSGTATLQAALARMPHVVVYIMDNFSWILATRILMPLLMEPDIHVAMANMLCIKSPNEPNNPIEIMLKSGYSIPCLECGRPLFVPEILQRNATPETLVSWLDKFRSDTNLRAAFDQGFKRLREMLEPGASSPSPADALIELILEKNIR
jgi:lipid-A-disaccharide synthase